MSRFFTKSLLHLSLRRLLSTIITEKSNNNKFKTFSQNFQECSKLQDFSNGAAAHARMITVGFSPTVFVSNCLVHMYVKCSNLDYAHKVFDRMTNRDTVSWNAMIAGFSNSGWIGMARSLFDEMPYRDVVSWNSMISGYSQRGDFYGSIDLFLQMGLGFIAADISTFAVVLRSCAAVEEFELGAQIHGSVVKLLLDCDVFVGSALVDMYAKCKKVGDSLQVFYEMPEKNWVAWSAAIAGCAHNEQFREGLQLFVEMQREAVGVSQSVYASVLRSCAGLSSVVMGIQIHAHALKTNFSLDVVVGTAILDMYAKSGNVIDARRVFEILPKRGLHSWNAIIVGYGRNGQPLEAMKLFRIMFWTNVGSNEVGLSAVLSACAEDEKLLQGAQLHCHAIKTSYVSDICVSNALIDMYGKCGALDGACVIFEEMEVIDSVSWNAIITALEQNNEYEDTLSHFDFMLQWGIKPDVFTYGSVLKACAALQSIDSGMKIHDRIIKSGLGLDPFLSSALIDMYCKCGVLGEADKLQRRLEERQTVVSWNAIISGFALQKQSEEAQKIFFKMLKTSIKPDSFTYATILDTCANLVTVELGKQIHAQIIKQKLLMDTYIASTLVDMYAKCGHMEDSSRFFEKTTEKDFVSWNAVICGYSQHGFGLEAILMFERMQEENVVPNHATFLAVLRACGHVGLVEKGEHYFELMTNYYKLEPQLEHYSCMVDLIGRCRDVKAAVDLIDNMPCEPDAVIWKTLLNACKIHGDVEIAELAVRSLLLFDPDDASAYILLSNIFAEAGMWDDVSRIRRILRETGLKKEPGCSWIEVKNETHAFLAGDKAHPNCNEIYERLDVLLGEMKQIKYLPETSLPSTNDVEEDWDLQDSIVAVCG